MLAIVLNSTASARHRVFAAAILAIVLFNRHGKLVLPMGGVILKRSGAGNSVGYEFRRVPFVTVGFAFFFPVDAFEPASDISIVVG